MWIHSVSCSAVLQGRAWVRFCLAWCPFFEMLSTEISYTQSGNVLKRGVFSRNWGKTCGALCGRNESPFVYPPITYPMWCPVIVPCFVSIARKLREEFASKLFQLYPNIYVDVSVNVTVWLSVWLCVHMSMWKHCYLSLVLQIVWLPCCLGLLTSTSRSVCGWRHVPFIPSPVTRGLTCLTVEV